jgi:hypothetical protein
MLKEYEAIRQEILVAMNNRISILSFGLATIGAIFTASIAVSATGTYSVLASLMLILAVPGINSFVLFMWMGEYQRMMRAGRFLFELEAKINKMAEADVLMWETQLRSQRLHMKYPYNTTVMLLTVIGIISIVLGLITLHLPSSTRVLIGLVGFLTHLAIYGSAVRGLSRLRR